MATGPSETDAPTPGPDDVRVRCSACGDALTAGANYCARCGQPTGEPSAPRHQGPAAAELGPEFGPSSAQRRQPVPLYRRRPLQTAAVAAVIAIGAAVFAIASGGSTPKQAGAVLAAPAGADGVTTYKAAHFSAKLLSTPVETQVPSSVGNLRFVLHLATVRTPNLEAIEEADFNPALPQSAIDPNLRATLASFAATSGMNLVSQSVTTFQGHAARQGVVSSATGQQYDVVAFIVGGSREYMLVAPTGSTYDDLAASFTILP